MPTLPRAALIVALLAAATPTLGDGVATNDNALPVQAYAGTLEPGERDDYPQTSPLYSLCTSGFQVVGRGATVRAVVPDGGPADMLVLHTYLPTWPWTPVETLLQGDPLQATAATADFVAGCPFFGLESRASAQRVTYLALTCSAVGPCPLG